MFIEGEDFDATFDTSSGPVGVLAEVEIHSSQLVLNALSIYPMENVDRLSIGLRQMLEIIRSIEHEAWAQGFDECVVNAKRLSGASPGRIVRLVRRLR